MPVVIPALCGSQRAVRGRTPLGVPRVLPAVMLRIRTRLRLRVVAMRLVGALGKGRTGEADGGENGEEERFHKPGETASTCEGCASSSTATAPKKHHPRRSYRGTHFPPMKSPSLRAVLLCSLLAASPESPAQTPAAAPAKPAAPAIAPTLANVPYGSHERQVLDFYKADSDKPTPLLFFIHGGGWVSGDKGGRTGASAKPYLAAGISVVSINYRYSWQAQLDGVKPPVKAPLEDAARALQFVRSKAKEWNIDKARIGASGGSAGACSSLWLAFHADMADPKSPDPVARESTRLWCAAVTGAQTSLDPKQLKEWTPNSRYGGHAFGFMDPNDRKTRDTRFAEFLEKRADVLPWIREYSPYEHVTADDPPVYLIYSSAPALGQEQRDPTHTANYGVKLQEHCKASGVDCELVYPGAPEIRHKTVDEYLIAKLKAPAAK